MLAYMRVYYQPFEINAMKFNEGDLSLIPDRGTHIYDFKVEDLQHFGYTFEDDGDYIRYAEAIYDILNNFVDSIDCKRATFEKAGHTSMSVGDYIVFVPVEHPYDWKCLMVAPAGWKVIEDYNGYVNQYRSVMDTVQNLPADIIEFVAFQEAQNPDTLRKDLSYYNSNKCENHCPKCNSDNIEWAMKDIQDDVIYQNAQCQDCQTEFTEQYRYSHTTID